MNTMPDAWVAVSGGLTKDVQYAIFHTIIIISNVFLVARVIRIDA